MRDFAWTDTLYCVIKDDGTFAGVPCLSYEEARELSNQHEGSMIYEMSPTLDDTDEDWDFNEDCGFDPYLGCYTDDC